uniref:Nuclear receptor domain-containing protein n=1 Tax=Steinernema glaseri TaxID=37863 RepID=A0A1I7Y272_9BILA
MGVVDQGIMVLTNGTFLSTKDTSAGYDGEEGMSAEEKQKRTVSLNISFQCKGPTKGKCRIFHEVRMICRACRYDKCILAGMRRSCVQKRRDLETTRRSRSSAQRSTPQEEVASNTSSEDSTEYGSHASPEPFSRDPFSPYFDQKSPVEPLSAPLPSRPRLLDFYVHQEQKAMDRRRVMFGHEDIGSLVDDHGGIPFKKERLVPYNVKSYHTNLRFDHLLTLEFLKSLPGYAGLCKTDKLSLYRYWVLGFGGIDAAYITSKMGVVDQGIMVLTNGTFLSTKDTSAGYDGEEGMSAEEKQKLFWPMYSYLHNGLIRPMDRLQVDQVEYTAMKALSLWQAVYFELTPEGKKLAKEHQTGIIEDFHEYYKDKEDGSVRMGTIILFIGSLFDMFKTIIDNYRQFEVFNLVELDVFSRQLLCI